jgi:hypothetical protein
LSRLPLRWQRNFTVFVTEAKVVKLATVLCHVLVVDVLLYVTFSLLDAFKEKSVESVLPNLIHSTITPTAKLLKKTQLLYM